MYVCHALPSRQQDRTAEDVDIIVAQLQVRKCLSLCVSYEYVCTVFSCSLRYCTFFPLQALKVFEGYPEEFLHDLASLASYEETIPNVTRASELIVTDNSSNYVFLLYMYSSWWWVCGVCCARTNQSTKSLLLFSAC